MNLLLDTHYLLWAALGTNLHPDADQMINDPANTLWFSVASLWEVGMKRGLGRPDFRVDPTALRAGLLSAGYRELAVEGRHILPLSALPSLHRDPFDRLLFAQALSEGMRLLTADARLASYGDPTILR